MTQEWSGTFDIKQSWTGTFDVTQAWAGTFDIKQDWAGTVDVFVEAASFVGAYDDISNLAAIYSMARRTLTSYTGNLVRLRRGSDNTEQDFGYDANGDLDTAAIATFLGASNGYIVTLYDQSGNGNDLSPTSNAKQPLYVASGQNGHPTWRFDGGVALMTVAFTLVQPATFMAVMKQVSWTENDYLWDGNANIAYLSQRSATPGIRIHAGNNLPSTADNNLAVGAFGICTAIYNGANSLFQVDDNAATAGDAGTSNPGGLTLGGSRVDSLWGNVEYAEVVVANTNWDADARAAAKSAADAYWGAL